MGQRPDAGQHDLTGQVYRHLGDHDDRSAVSVILKLRGETCDIDCLYCLRSARKLPVARESPLTRSSACPIFRRSPHRRRTARRRAA